MSSEPSWNCSRTEIWERSIATGSMPPDLWQQTRPMTTNARQLNYKAAVSRRPSSGFNTVTCTELRQICRGQSIHHFVHHQTQFEPDVHCYRWPMQPITDQAGNMQVFSCLNFPLLFYGTITSFGLASGLTFMEHSKLCNLTHQKPAI